MNNSNNNNLFSTEQVTNPNEFALPENMPENNRPLDNMVLSKYDEQKDRGILKPGENFLPYIEKIVEEKPKQAKEIAENINAPKIKQEAEQVTDGNPKNIEANNAEMELDDDKFFKFLDEAERKAPQQSIIQKLESQLPYSYYNDNPDDFENPKDWDMWLTDDDRFEALLEDSEVPIAQRYTKAMSKLGSCPSFNERKKVKDLKKKVLHHIANHPDSWSSRWDQIADAFNKDDHDLKMPGYFDVFNAKRTNDIKDMPLTDEEYAQLSKEIAETEQPIGPETAKEVEQLHDGDKRTDEVANKAIKKDLIDWDKVHIYAPNEDPYYKIDTYDEDAPTYHGYIESKDEDFLGPDETYDEEGNIIQKSNDESVVDYGLEDQNQYNEALTEDETIVDESMANAEPLNWETDFEPAPEAPYADNVGQLKREVEELEALPVTDKESAKKKQNALKAKRLQLRQAIESGATFHSSTMPHQSMPHQSQSRSGPSAGVLMSAIGGGGGAHSGSINKVATKPIYDTSKGISAGGGSMPVTMKSGSSVTIAPSRSFSNGNLASGSFGLMSKHHNNSNFKVESPELVAGGGHTSAEIESPNMFDNPENMKDALIKRLRNDLDKLDPETKKSLGFSTQGYSWKGKRIEYYDGYTLQQLISKVEEVLNSEENYNG